MKYPSRVVESSNKGKALIATRDLEIGTIVEKFEGPIIRYKEVPEEMICHAIFVGKDKDHDEWVNSRTDAIYVNHSCDPNCRVDDELNIVTIKKIKKGEELTYTYNLLEEGEKASDFFWDHRWDFKCKCGAKKCQGMIDRYR